MNRNFACLAFSLLVAAAASASLAQDWQGKDYNLSMAGALINDHCGRVWEGGEYVSIHACNYQLANLFNVAVSTQHFEECTVLAQGDIVMIADCMVERFNSWLGQQSQ
ncbi:MAG: hypothetical protein COB20_14305 [SAR86 cluster bacterium]|uniref:Uncharacterized protein n=1 Tax=SAR86 cluster bacterium TaxID=2030880 RepID=A0A2A4WX64_9GAMM|nr:MAG: hypothetical protein COB20_14305 [SAR86 cluster bacterium]